MISPGEIPQYTGDFDKLSKAVTDLRKRAIGVRRNGQDVHSRFQATAAYYQAPEADQLFSSTWPVMDTADTFAGHIESLADALDTFAAEAKPYANRLKRLREQAFAFVGSVEGDDDWTKDQDKVDAHQALMDGVAEAVAGFQEAESNAARKIGAISPALCRPGPVAVGADTLKSMEDLPWGSPEGRAYDRWSLDWWGHGVKSWAWDGIVKDSIWGGFVGLGILVDNLVGVNGDQAQEETWDGLRRTLVGVYAYGMEAAGQGDHLSDWQRGSEAYTKEFGKGFIAYDQWQEDPARAHAVTTFNVLTLFAGGAGGLARLGKGGRFAQTAGTVAKVGDILDPISGTAKAARGLSNLPKVSEVLTNVTAHLKLPKSHFPETALDLSNRYRIDRDGNLVPLHPDGTPNPTPAVREPAAADRVASSPSAGRQTAGVGARVGESTAHVGDELSPRGHHDTAGAGGSSTDSRSGAHADHGRSAEGTAHGNDPQQTTGDSGSHGGGSDGHTPPANTLEPHSSESGTAAGARAAESEPPLDPQRVDERIKELDDRRGGEGHAPGRHLYPEDRALRDRLGNPKLDSSGNPVQYGPNSSNAGHVKSENNIDPLTGTTVDGVTGRTHRVGPYATRFDHAEDMVRADQYFRDEIARTGEPPDAELPISDLLGPEGHNRFSGFYRNPENLEEFLPVDFEGGSIRGVYRLEGNDWKLITMYANPAPGRHP